MVVLNCNFLMVNVLHLNLFLDLYILVVTYLSSLGFEIPSPSSKWPEAFCVVCFWLLQFRVADHEISIVFLVKWILLYEKRG